MSPPSNRIISHKTAKHRTPFYERTAYLNFKWHNRISHFMKRRRRTISIMTISWLKVKLTKNKATTPSNYIHKDLRKDHQGNQLGNHFNQLTIINRARFLMKLKFRDIGAKWQSAKWRKHKTNTSMRFPRKSPALAAPAIIKWLLLQQITSSMNIWKPQQWHWGCASI